MKAHLLLLLLLPMLCSAKDFYIECYGEDHLTVHNLLQQCRSKVQQACYTRRSGEKGCVTLDQCSQPGWTCCYTDRCNA